jgi:hypothetical protein
MIDEFHDTKAQTPSKNMFTRSASDLFSPMQDALGTRKVSASASSKPDGGQVQLQLDPKVLGLGLSDDL